MALLLYCVHRNTHKACLVFTWIAGISWQSVFFTRIQVEQDIKTNLTNLNQTPPSHHELWKCLNNTKKALVPAFLSAPGRRKYRFFTRRSICMLFSGRLSPNYSGGLASSARAWLFHTDKMVCHSGHWAQNLCTLQKTCDAVPAAVQ